MMVLDKVATETKNIKIRFAVLFHDIGKGSTPRDKLPKHHGHDINGVEIIKNLSQQYKNDWKKAASFVAKYHMRIYGLKHKGKIIRFYEEMKRSSGLSMNEFLYIIRADQGIKSEIPWFLNQKIMDAVLGTKTEIEPGSSIGQIKNKIIHGRIKTLDYFSRKKG